MGVFVYQSHVFGVQLRGDVVVGRFRVVVILIATNLVVRIELRLSLVVRGGIIVGAEPGVHSAFRQRDHAGHWRLDY